MRLLALLLLVVTSSACAPTRIAPLSEVAVTRVIDGDTFDVGTSRVRLIGVNAPEHDECFGTEATEELARLIQGATVTLETDAQAYDAYGRALAYTYLDGRSVNLDLVAGGFALAQAYPPNTRHQDELNAAMTAAQDHRIGMWAEDACGRSSDDVSIESIAANPPGPDENVLDEETITIVATSSADLTGWVLRDGSSSHRFHLPNGFVLNGRVTIHSGCGTDTTTDLFWCADGPIWDNDGDTALIYDESGALVDAVTYPPDE
ncbi:MAG: thermonuclease family protein [Acidimicrobiia bacterium]